jgi:hypothetical protein
VPEEPGTMKKVKKKSHIAPHYVRSTSPLIRKLSERLGKEETTCAKPNGINFVFINLVFVEHIICSVINKIQVIFRVVNVPDVGVTSNPDDV